MLPYSEKRKKVKSISTVSFIVIYIKLIIRHQQSWLRSSCSAIESASEGFPTFFRKPGVVGSIHHIGSLLDGPLNTDPVLIWLYCWWGVNQRHCTQTLKKQVFRIGTALTFKSQNLGK